METLRRDPFRLLFPLGAALALAGVGPWILFSSGVSPGWPGLLHALTMTQAFLAAIAVGFLGTMIPRRTLTGPMSGLELVAFALGLAAVPLFLFASSVGAAQVSYLLVLALLARFLLVRLGARAATRRPAPLSFVFIPAGLVAATTGALLLIASTWGERDWRGPGRSLAEEGLLEALVLAIAPLLTPTIADGGGLADPLPGWRARLPLVLAAAAFLGSFALQALVGERAGFALRGAVLAGVLLIGARWRWPTARGLHRRVYCVALLLMPAGLLIAAALPAMRLGALHVTFIGGLSLLVYAVTFHVVFLHTGRGHLAAGRPWPVYAVAALTLLAALVRLSAEQTGSGYFLALALASTLWLAGALLWGCYLTVLLLRPLEVEGVRS